MWQDIIAALAIAGASAVKFVVGFFGGLTAGYNFFELFLLNVGGGMIGVFVYIYLWDYILKAWTYFFPKKTKKKKKAKRTWLREFIVVVVRKYKLTGIAVLTPILLSVPVGTLMASALVKNKPKIFKYMFLAFAFWNMFFFGLFRIFGIRLDEFFEKLLG